MNLSKNIASRRKQLNMTQEKLAERANITVNYLSKLERNRANDVKLSTLLKLSKSLNLSLDLLVNGTEKETTTTSGPYQKKLFLLINQYDTNQAETISKNIIELLKINRPTNP